MGAVEDLVEGSSYIYYLARGEEGSAWHKLSVDEYWSFNRGQNIRYVKHLSYCLLYEANLKM